MSNSSGFRVLIAESDPIMSKIVLNQVACAGHLAEELSGTALDQPGSNGSTLDLVVVHWSIASAENFTFLQHLENSSPPIPYIVMLRDKDGPTGALQQQLADRGSRFFLQQPFSADSLEEIIAQTIDALPDSLRKEYYHRMSSENVCKPFEVDGEACVPSNDGGQSGYNNAQNMGAAQGEKPVGNLDNKLRSAMSGLSDTSQPSEERQDKAQSLTEEEQAVVNWFDDPEFLGSTQFLRDSNHFQSSLEAKKNGSAVVKAAEPSAPYGEASSSVVFTEASAYESNGHHSGISESAKESSAITARRHFSQGKEALSAQDYSKAVRHFTGVLQLKPGSPQAYKGLAVAFRGKGDWKRSCYFLGRACQSFIWCGKFEEGLAMHNEMKRRGITTVHPFGAVAQALVKRGRLDKALQLLEQGRSIAPKDADLLWAYALLLSFKGDNKAAIGALDDLLTSAAKHKDAKNLRAQLLSKPPKPHSDDDSYPPEI